jgi:hypothetical protein
MATTTSFYGVCVGEQTGGAVSGAEVLEVFDILKPKASTTALIRIGGDHDGSYLVPDDLEGIAACYSPGVNRIKYFEDFLADRYGITSHMCDFSCDVDELETPLKPGMQTFLKKWLDVEPGADHISLEQWIKQNQVDGDLLLQMDIEGAEYRNILATDNETLARFRVMVLEVHGLGAMLDRPTLRGVIAPFFRKLARDFTCVHAHPNNCCGDFLVSGTDVRIPNVLELTLLRNDRFVEAPGPPSLPHPLDVACNMPDRPPLFLSDAWSDHQRTLASRVKMLEDRLQFQDSLGASSLELELSGLLSLTMRSLETVGNAVSPSQRRSADVFEVAQGRFYLLSSAYGGSNMTGEVAPRGNYFFHTAVGRNQYIQIDLGQPRRVQRIEVTNRRDGFPERAKYLFAVLAETDSPNGATSVFPMSTPEGAWMECGTDVPGVLARYVTITSPVNTALHFSDLRVYAGEGSLPA